MEKYKTLRIFLLEKEIRGVREMLLKLEIFFTLLQDLSLVLYTHVKVKCVCVRVLVYSVCRGQRRISGI